MIASLRVLCGVRGLGLVPRSARPTFLLVRVGVVMLSAFCPRARVSGGRVRPVAARVLLPLSVWVSLRLPHSIPPGSLYGLLTRFRALTPPRVRFSPVWPSTDRTVSERWVWWVVVAC